MQVDERLELPGHRRFSLLKAWPETGRTHQVRVHLSHVGFPILGDKIYARGSRHYLDFIAHGWTKEMESEIWLSRHALHSSSLRIDFGGQKLEWTSPMPARSGEGHCAVGSCADLLALSALPFDDDGFSDSFCDTLTVSAVLQIAIILRI